MPFVTNWPPLPPGSYPSWPPAELNVSRLEYSDIRSMINDLTSRGFTRANSTPQENNAYFRGVLCDEGHQTQGIMLVSPLGIRYPFAYCVGATHKQLLVLWGPDYCMGGMSAQE